MPEKDYDFCGWATKNDLLCSDGRVIKRNAFKDQDGSIVPLVWNHDHNDPKNVLGHALLKNEDHGVYSYCYFNDTENGQTAKDLVSHGDIVALSIWANKLKHNGNNVVHGVIREVSLVLAGANPGALIEPNIAHADSEDDIVIETYFDDNLNHSEGDEEEEVEEAPIDEEEPTDEELDAADEAAEEESEEEVEEEVEESDEVEHSDGGKENMAEERTVQDVLDSMDEEQRNVVNYLVGEALNEANAVEHSDEEDNEMGYNVFDNDANFDEEMAHSEEIASAMADAKRYGSMKESFLQHGIENIDYLFPDAKNLTKEPGFIDIHPKEWVNVIMNGVHHTPFSRIKMINADITDLRARAKGYVKGNVKIEEVFSLLKRTVNPTTIYKKQKLDRDDVIDITDFDVVAWLKKEMRMKLDEELARAFVFGDGRLASDEDKINELNIIPVMKDTSANLYAMEKTITPGSGESVAHAIINGVVKAMDDYEGSGNTTAFLTQSLVSDMMLLEDNEGRRLYRTLADVAAAMTVNRIVRVPASVMPSGYHGVVLDLSDYNVGADKGGAINMFDDFDIDYNAEKYLIETRCSGALVVPHSAIVLKAAA